MDNVVLKIENVSKQYRLGQVGTGTISNDLNRWWHKLRRKEDPFLTVGTINDRNSDAKSEYVWALKDIDFDVKQGEVVGIIGKNGAGKSTLLKILSRVTTPTIGKIKVKGRIASLLEVGTGFQPELSGRENIFLNGAILGMTKSEIKAKLDEIVDFSGVGNYIDTPVKRYSSGMYVRLAFAVAAHLEPEILIIDEVLAVGDADFQKKCLGKMKHVSQQGRTVLFVSHNMPSVKALCTRGVILKHGRVDFQGDIQPTIDKYFESTIKMEKLGIIPDKFERYNTGEAKITKAAILNNKDQPTDEVFFQAAFKMSIEIKVEKKIAEAVIDVKIVTKDGIILSHSINVFDGSKPYVLEVGMHQFETIINNPMQPGFYSLSCGVHHMDGRTIDYLENFYDFTILKIAEGTNEDYKFNWQQGYIQIPSKWTKMN